MDEKHMPQTNAVDLHMMKDVTSCLTLLHAKVSVAGLQASADNLKFQKAASIFWAHVKMFLLTKVF